MSIEWKLPELGEGIDSAAVLKVLVKVGDTVLKEQPIIEIETDKVNVEVPSSVAGKVERVHIKEGDTLKVGDLVLTLSGEAEVVAAKASVVTKTVTETPKQPTQPKTKPSQIPAPVARVPARVQNPSGIRTSPAVRKLARELGLDVEAIAESCPDGHILLDDVKEYARELIAQSSGEKKTELNTPALPDFTNWGSVKREAMSTIRKKTAERMSLSWQTIPHVTHFDQADITDLEEQRKKLSTKMEKKEGKLTVTAIIIKIAADALKQFPKLNSSIDLESKEIIFKEFVNIGVAVDTEQGLIVPVIKNADKKSLNEITAELNELSVKARDKKLGLEDIQGATFTITNLGGIGASNFTPIINWPEVAILAVSRGQITARTAAGKTTKWEPRLILPLGLSYDHRIIDGADAARFVKHIVGQLSVWQ